MWSQHAVQSVEDEHSVTANRVDDRREAFLAKRTASTNRRRVHIVQLDHFLFVDGLGDMKCHRRDHHGDFSTRDVEQ